MWSFEFCICKWNKNKWHQFLQAILYMWYLKFTNFVIFDICESLELIYKRLVAMFRLVLVFLGNTESQHDCKLPEGLWRSRHWVLSLALVRFAGIFLPLCKLPCWAYPATKAPHETKSLSGNFSNTFLPLLRSQTLHMYQEGWLLRFILTNVCSTYAKNELEYLNKLQWLI